VAVERLLTVEDAGDLRVGVVHGQAADQVDGVLVGAEPLLLPGDDRDGQVGDGAAFPAEHQIGAARGPVDGDDDLAEQRGQEFLAVPVGGARRCEDDVEVFTQRQDLCFLLGCQNCRCTSPSISWATPSGAAWPVAGEATS